MDTPNTPALTTTPATAFSWTPAGHLFFSHVPASPEPLTSEMDAYRRLREVLGDFERQGQPLNDRAIGDADIA
jgi:hypothetical protein